MKFKNAYDLIHGFKDHLFVQYPFGEAKTRWNQLQTAVTRYTIKGWGLHFTQDDTKLRKLNTEQLEKAWSFLTTISVETFIHDALNAQCQGFAYFEVSNKTQYTYRCALNKSIEFGKSAEFSKSADSHCPPDRIPFKLRRGYGRVSDNPVI